MRPDRSEVRVSGHLPGLDGVRGLAILMVMAVHFVGDATPLAWGQRLVVKLGRYGVLGIALFLVLPRLANLPAPLEEARDHQAWLWTYTANFYIASKASLALPYVSHFWSL